jgi:hypothetical protein
MKNHNSIKNIFQYILILIFYIIVDLYFGNIVYRTHESVVKGILGITFLFLVYRIYIAPKQIVWKPTQLLSTDYLSLKYFFIGMFWAIVNYWALRQIIDAVIYLFKLFNN